jgi:hypothetical protein
MLAEGAARIRPGGRQNPQPSFDYAAADDVGSGVAGATIAEFEDAVRSVWAGVPEPHIGTSYAT